MKENEVLNHLLETLCQEYDDLGKRIAPLDQSDSKVSRLSNSRNRKAALILATISLMRDPKRKIMIDNADKSMRDVARMAKELRDEEANQSENMEKSSLMAYKDKYGRIIPGPAKLRHECCRCRNRTQRNVGRDNSIVRACRCVRIHKPNGS